MLAHAVTDLRAYLLGRWRLSRRIVDHGRGVTGTFDGEALFTPRGDDLLYREQGVMRLGDFSGSAFRDYLYTFPAPARARVLFDDGHPFHEVDLSQGAAEARHLCGADTYHGRYDLDGPAAWTLAWRVTGPHKDLDLTAVYRRPAEAQAACR
ncbi:MAG: hypothetical protein H6907_13720 [Hyphomicrobiales bacterium]|nr:hypothetical protein [Hyphomicrobiales bacterium]MCP5372782.1 hypothetical protein [Hyphomicrobiales bacterium]